MVRCTFTFDWDTLDRLYWLEHRDGVNKSALLRQMIRREAAARGLKDAIGEEDAGMSSAARPN